MSKYRRIKYEDRCQIYALSKRGSSQESIAEVLGVSQSAVSREIHRNRGERGYRFKQVEAKAQARQAIRSKPRKLTVPTRSKIEAKLRQMPVVSLRSQRITVYDADGWIMRAPVSSGQVGRETPAGIFSVIQKDAEHHSNLYDDAYMPRMQRLTWSGIALHGGLLPGHPASHGCIRLPYDFAAHLFDLTKLGMRVIVAPSDVAPVSIAHPALFEPRADARDAAAARVSEAEEAAKKADQARLAAYTASREVAQATMPLRRMRNLKLREEERLADAERSITSAVSVEAKEAAEAEKANSAAKIAELETQLVPAEAELQPKINALAALRAAAVAAEEARAEAEEAAHALARPEPVSVFISRKTQRLYVRRAFEPIFDIPITIRDTDLPIGTHVFTASQRSGPKGDMQWSVVSFVGSNVGHDRYSGDWNWIQSA